MDDFKIISVKARELLDSRGFPTVEAEVVLSNCGIGKAIVPSGASTGSHEAYELRDQDEKEITDANGNPWSSRYLGKGVLTAVKHVNTQIQDALKGMDARDQGGIDLKMKALDGSDNFKVLGANATLAVSLAVARAAANGYGLPLYRYLGGIQSRQMPVPMMNIINGGVHAKNDLDFQEFMIMPVGATTFHEALRMGAEIYQHLKQLLGKENKNISVGDEGGFAPDIKDTFEVFAILKQAVEKAGYELEKDIVFAMDAASSELYEANSGLYQFIGESRQYQRIQKKTGLPREEFPDSIKSSILRSTKEMIDYYETLTQKYPLYSIEDGLQEDDFEGWKRMTNSLGEKIQLVGDDLFVTNKNRLKKGIQEKVANSILIKPNQIGTLTETMETVTLAHNKGYRTIMSHRSGDTEDSFIADLSIGLGCSQIKTGAPCRSERVAKYNQLLRIEEEIGVGASLFRR